MSANRKRVFLGQIGVCTIDQVLVSVLPVRHHFVRGFGVGKSVLIVDEVHAYDFYMYGLLDEVLKIQRASGGSAILLSATLPAHQREMLLSVWQAKGNAQLAAPYPLISHCGQTGEVIFFLPVQETHQGQCLLDGRLLDSLGDEVRDEAFNLNTVSVPSTWRGWLKELPSKDGLIFLPMTLKDDAWEAKLDRCRLSNSEDLGLRLFREV